MRYQYKIGPGYDDEKAKENNYYAYNGLNYDAQYGDYYVWSQVLDYVGSNPQRAVVYVTNDAKSDFFYKIDGQTRGPNESLITEMKNKGASEFLLQNIDTFLHHANTHLHANIGESAIDELANASKNGRRNHHTWNIQKKLLFLSENPDSVTKYLATGFTIEKLHDLHISIQKSIHKCRHEINFLKAQSKELDDAELSEVNFKIDNLTQRISKYRFLSDYLKNRINPSQELDAIQQILDDIDRMSATD